MPAEHGSDDPVNTAGLAEPLDPDDVLVARPEDDDYDLLTFGEAGARLTEEMIKLERRIDSMLADPASADRVPEARDRLEVLRHAAERNRKRSIEELRESGFFDAPG